MLKLWLQMKGVNGDQLSGVAYLNKVSVRMNMFLLNFVKL